MMVLSILVSWSVENAVQNGDVSAMWRHSTRAGLTIKDLLRTRVVPGPTFRRSAGRTSESCSDRPISMRLRQEALMLVYESATLPVHLLHSIFKGTVLYVFQGYEPVTKPK